MGILLLILSCLLYLACLFLTIGVPILFCIKINKRLRPQKSEELAKHNKLYAGSIILRTFCCISAVLAYEAFLSIPASCFNNAIYNSYLYYNRDPSIDATIYLIQFGLLVFFLIILGVTYTYAAKIQDELDTYTYQTEYKKSLQFLPNIKLKSLPCPDIQAPFPEKRFCMDMLRMLIRFAGQHDHEILNANNYCACDILLFAASLGKTLLCKKQDLENANEIADRYYTTMNQIAISFCMVPAKNQEILQARWIRVFKDVDPADEEKLVQSLIHDLYFDVNETLTSNSKTNAFQNSQSAYKRSAQSILQLLYLEIYNYFDRLSTNPQSMADSQTDNSVSSTGKSASGFPVPELLENRQLKNLYSPLVQAEEPAKSYCADMIAKVIQFAMENDHLSFNKNNYCAFDTLMFAAVLGQYKLRQSASGSKEAIAVAFLNAMSQAVCIMCSVDENALRALVTQRRYIRLRNGLIDKESTTQTVADILCADVFGRTPKDRLTIPYYAVPAEYRQMTQKLVSKLYDLICDYFDTHQ